MLVNQETQMLVNPEIQNVWWKWWMRGGARHQFISMRDRPNQSFYLEGHSSSAVMMVMTLTMTMMTQTITIIMTTMTMVRFLPWGTLAEYWESVDPAPTLVWWLWWEQWFLWSLKLSCHELHEEYSFQPISFRKIRNILYKTYKKIRFGTGRLPLPPHGCSAADQARFWPPCLRSPRSRRRYKTPENTVYVKHKLY